MDQVDSVQDQVPTTTDDSKTEAKIDPTILNDDDKNDDTKRRKLVGHANFIRHNPMSDHFKMNDFAHVEFYCQEATSISRRFGWGLGMSCVGKSDQSTGNASYASYIMQSGSLQFIFTAPYSKEAPKAKHVAPYPGYDLVRMNEELILSL